MQLALSASVLMASCSFLEADAVVNIWDSELGDPILKLDGHSDEINMVAISTDSKLVASASEDKTLKLWSLSTGEQLLTLEGHQEA